MKVIRYLSIISAIVVLSAFTLLNTASWEIQKGYAIKFSGSKVSGEFTKFYGTIDFDTDTLANAKFDLTIDVKSISTGNGLMNEHAIGEDWFNAEKYPDIKFVSSRFSKTTGGFQVTGKLTMHGVTKEITIPFNFSNNTFTSRFEVNRGDYNVGGTSGMQGWVAPTLQIEVSVPVKQKDK